MPTLKEKPKDVVLKSHEYMLRAGMIRMVSAGFYNYLPLGYRVLKRIQKVIEEEMDKIGAQETVFPSLIARRFFEISGRWATFRDELYRFQDAGGSDVALAPTHEELFTELLANFVSSHKRLPLTLYQVSPKFRNEIRARSGLMRAREFKMKDAYSFHMNEESLDEGYLKMKDAYGAILNRLGLEHVAVGADSGAMGGSGSEEFMVFSEAGEDKVVVCPECGYGANLEKAVSSLSHVVYEKSNLEEVLTPNMKSIEAVSSFLKVDLRFCGKIRVYKRLNLKNEFEKWVFVFIRGDFEVNDVKLRNCFSEEMNLLAAEADEIEGVLKLPLGFMGPNASLEEKFELLVDESVDDENGYYIVGANKKDYHLKGFNLKRDLKRQYQKKDVRLVKEGDVCASCGAVKLEMKSGIEVGHIFKLGDKYAKAFDWKVVDEDGVMKHPLMGSYGIGLDRLIAAFIEQHHDEKGIVWGRESAPFDAIILSMSEKDELIVKASETLYNNLQKEGYSVLWDDTDHRAGFKFNNAELIGIPFQLIVGSRRLEEEKVEVKMRYSGKVELVFLKDVPSFIKEKYRNLF